MKILEMKPYDFEALRKRFSTYHHDAPVMKEYQHVLACKKQINALLASDITEDEESHLLGLLSPLLDAVDYLGGYLAMRYCNKSGFTIKY